MSKAIAFIAGSWCSYCAMVGDYDGAMAILVIYGILAIKKGYDRRKQSHPEINTLRGKLYMNEFNLSKLNAKVGDNCVFVSNLAVRYQSAATPEERMAMAIKMENAATMLRISAERLATETKNVYGGKDND